MTLLSSELRRLGHRRWIAGEVSSAPVYRHNANASFLKQHESFGHHYPRFKGDLREQRLCRQTHVKLMRYHINILRERSVDAEAGLKADFSHQQFDLHSNGCKFEWSWMKKKRLL